MHTLMLKEVIAIFQQREREGDHPTVKPFTVEQLEGAVVQLAQERDDAPRKTMETLIEVFIKVCPEVLPIIKDAHAKVQAKDEAFDRLMAVLREENPPTHESTLIPREHIEKVLRQHGYNPEKVLDERK